MEAVEEEGAVEGPAYIDDRYVFGKEEGEIDEEGVSVCQPYCFEGRISRFIHYISCV